MVLKKKVVAGYLYEDETIEILKAANLSGWNITEVISFFIRWSLQNFKYEGKKDFNDALTTALVNAQMDIYRKTPEFEAAVDVAVKKELENANK